ncbi:MAG: DUF1573 domain-containing protein [Bacteroidia bacterium]
MKKTIFLLMPVLLFACGGNQGHQASTDLVNNPATADSTKMKKTDGVAKIRFEEMAHDFGDITQGEVLDYGFIFTNTGTADLLISDASASCGCTVPEYPKEPTAPGKKGRINVKFNSALRMDRFNKEVYVTANTEPMVTTLTISGNIKAKTQPSMAPNPNSH